MRPTPEVVRRFVSDSVVPPFPSAEKLGRSADEILRTVPPAPKPPVSWDSWMTRAIFLVCVALLAFTLRPFGLGSWPTLGLGLFVGAGIVLAEWRLRRMKFGALLGGALGAVLGATGAALFAFVVSRTATAEPAKSFLAYGTLLGLAYLGLMLGASQGKQLRIEELFAERTASPAAESLKLLDTSVLIDGRIADICEAQFLDGVLVVPQFVLHELQLVADSSDGLRRQRGRRGLDVLERMQKIPGITVRILHEDSVSAADVDHKLVELAQRSGAKIVTNDFNLNKVATLQGLNVLNVNQLANALKPVVLPGEPMRVLILREGKEVNQGVAYLDDGTMVVVDAARRFINKSVNIIVTSVHQTTAGKMIFGRMDERGEPAMTPPLRQAAAAARGDGNRATDSPTFDRHPGPIFPPSDVE
jgi:uncharacterized protein YacL